MVICTNLGYCGGQGEPAILISRLLLRTRRMYSVCSQHSFGLPLRMNGMHRTQFDYARLDFLSLVIWSRVFWPSVTYETYTKHSDGAEAFGPSIVVYRTP